MKLRTDTDMTSLNILIPQVLKRLINGGNKTQCSGLGLKGKEFA
jgi:hypothetical protein